MAVRWQARAWQGPHITSFLDEGSGRAVGPSRLGLMTAGDHTRGLTRLVTPKGIMVDAKATKSLGTVPVGAAVRRDPLLQLFDAEALRLLFPRVRGLPLLFFAGFHDATSHS